MKTFGLYFKITLYLIMITIVIPSKGSAKQKPTLAIASFETKGMSTDNISRGNLLRLELVKINKFEVLDKYHAADQIKLHAINLYNCFGK